MSNKVSKYISIYRLQTLTYTHTQSRVPNHAQINKIQRTHRNSLLHNT